VSSLIQTSPRSSSIWQLPNGARGVPPVFITQTKFISKAFAMSQMEVAAARADLVLGPQLVRASVRFVASVAALIGVSLLLACL
jgi:hypothetical protein